MAGIEEENADFLYLLAYLYMQQAKYNLALPLFRILRLHTATSNIKIALALASCLHKAKHFDEALKVIDSIDEVSLGQEQKIAFFYIKSKILWDLKQVEASRDMLHKYLKLRNLNA